MNFARPAVGPALLMWLCASIASCAGGPGDEASGPAWVDRPDAALPRDVYLSAVGVDRTRTLAERAARARLAQQIAARVSATEVASVEETERSAGGGPVSASRRTSLARNIRIETDQVLPASEIVEVHTDPTSGDVYALAALDREKAAAAWRDQMSAELARSRRGLDAADVADGPLARLALLREARDASRRAFELRAAMAVIAPTRARAPNIAADLHPDAVDRRIDALRPHITVAVESSPAAPSALERALRDAVDRRAAPAPAGTRPAALVLRIAFESRPLPNFEPRKALIEWSVSVHAMNPDTARALDTLAADGVASGATEPEARRRAEQAAIRAIEPELTSFLDRWLSPRPDQWPPKSTNPAIESKPR